MANSIMQLNYDNLKSISKVLQNEGDDFTQFNAHMRQQLSSLQHEWQGDAARLFFCEMNDVLLPALQRLPSALFSAEAVLNQIINIIYEADLEVSQYFNGLDGGNILSGSLLSALQNLYTDGKNFLDGMKSFLGKVAKDSGLNLFDINFTKNVVGLLDSLQLFKKFDVAMFGKKIPLVGPLIGIVLGTVQDGLEGKDWLRSLKVNSVDALLQYGVGLTGVGEVVLLSNSAVQIKGTVSIFTDKLFANLFADDATRQSLLHQADLKADALKKMDLGNITKSLSEVIVDSRTAQDTLRNDLVNTLTFQMNVTDAITDSRMAVGKVGDDLLNTLKSVGNVADGLADMGVLDPGMLNTTTPTLVPSTNQVVLRDWVVQHMPISDSLKQASALYTHQFVQTQTDIKNALVNVFDGE